MSQVTACGDLKRIVVKVMKKSSENMQKVVERVFKSPDDPLSDTSSGMILLGLAFYVGDGDSSEDLLVGD
ncbi:hypothetical protein HAX54_034742 [Datura stramonium]|uniref:Uncharacterized protein n=1 Tax=Datura stramonium TaxID=4076 RepID=A0ABS8VH41_DATST|nr:hypothetical protein [Datura stramonium]